MTREKKLPFLASKAAQFTSRYGNSSTAQLYLPKKSSFSRGMNPPLGYVHATRKAAFFRQVKLRSSQVSIATRKLRSFTCLKKQLFSWHEPTLRVGSCHKKICIF